VANSLPPAAATLWIGSARSGSTTFQFFSAGWFTSTLMTRPFGAPWFVSISSDSPTLSITLYDASPMSGINGRNAEPDFDRSRTKSALPSFPLPRSDT
jgi:hypothetical protein